MNIKETVTIDVEETLRMEMMELLFKNIKHEILSLNESAFPTGNNFWCNGTRDSDYDICISEAYRSEIEGIIKHQHLTYRYAAYNNGYYITVGSRTINIIFLSNDELQPWKLATEIMTILMREFGCIRVNKSLRCGIFESLRAIIKILRSYVVEI